MPRYTDPSSGKTFNSASPLSPDELEEAFGTVSAKPKPDFGVEQGKGPQGAMSPEKQVEQLQNERAFEAMYGNGRMPGMDDPDNPYFGMNRNDFKRAALIAGGGTAAFAGASNPVALAKGVAGSEVLRHGAAMAGLPHWAQTAAGFLGGLGAGGGARGAAGLLGRLLPKVAGMGEGGIASELAPLASGSVPAGAIAMTSSGIVPRGPVSLQEWLSAFPRAVAQASPAAAEGMAVPTAEVAAGRTTGMALRDFAKEQLKRGVDPGQGDKVWIALDQAGNPASVVTPDQAGALTRKGGEAAVTWIKKAFVGAGGTP